MKSTDSRIVVLAALAGNIVIAASKFLAAFLTGSSAMIAEGIHSLADTLNQVFLLIGLRRARKEANFLHPFGFSGESYFWSFIVAIFLFTVGAIFSIYEGWQKLRAPQPVEKIHYAFAVLAVAWVVEFLTFRLAFKRINYEKKDVGIIHYLRKTKRAELLVVFLEDLAALVGLTIAAVMLAVEYLTGILIFDGLASVFIGVLLAVVALFLGMETKSLLIGEGADPALLHHVYQIFRKEENVNRVIHIKSLQLGPEDILLAAKVEFDHHLTMAEISRVIDGIEREIRQQYPEFKKIFVEPDICRYS